MRTSRFLLWAALAFAALAATLALARPPGAQTSARPHGPGRARLLGTTTASADVSFDLVLHLRERALDRYLSGLFDPHSPLYGRHLDPNAFGRRFGPSTGELSALSVRLRAAGFRIVGTYPQRTSVRVRGSAAAVHGLLQITLHDYLDPAGHRYHAPDRKPAIPHSLTRWVDTVAGLDTRSYGRMDYLPYGALRPIDGQSAYDTLPLYQPKIGSFDGNGQTIALLSIDHFSQGDLDTFRSKFSLHSGPKVKTVVISNSGDTSTGESNLDTQVITAIAPRAQIIDYQLAFPDLAQAINRIVSDRKATIVSGSFGMCDGTARDANRNRVDPGFRTDVERALLAAASAGVSFFFSTGDTGAFDCQRSDSTDRNVTAHFPSDAPYTVAVGGTVLSVGDDGSYQGETGWDDTNTNGGGGGGLNPYDRRPPWQNSQQVRVPGISNGNRQTPDVSAAAGTGSPWYVHNRGGWYQMWGTSASTPFWAASMLIVQQYMLKKHAGPLCFATPLLYALAERSWPFPPFHDITVGDNRFYQTEPGWDFATGWGSPDVYNLATAAVAYRQRNPLPGNNACAGQIR
ncbi:MAG: hypothetical protein E6J20_18660 [Chloroflexi bacterium]|nr:MAG: hypothetical protein E6J20_18660 [Chloroflexota bacterium]